MKPIFTKSSTHNVWSAQFPDRAGGITVVIIDDVAPIIGANGGFTPESANDGRLLSLIVNGIAECKVAKCIVVAAFDFDYRWAEELLSAGKSAFLVDLLAGRKELKGKDVVDQLIRQQVDPKQIGILTKAKEEEVRDVFGRPDRFKRFQKLVNRSDDPFYTPGAAEEKSLLVDPIVEWILALHGNPYLLGVAGWVNAGKAKNMFLPPNPHDIQTRNGWLNRIRTEGLREPPDKVKELLEQVFQAPRLRSISAAAGMFGLKGITHGVLSARLVAEVLGVSADDCEAIGLLGQSTLLNAFNYADIAQASVGFAVLAEPPKDAWLFQIKSTDPFSLLGKLDCGDACAAQKAAEALNMDEVSRGMQPGRDGDPGCCNRAANAIRKIACLKFSHSGQTLYAELSISCPGNIL